MLKGETPDYINASTAHEIPIESVWKVLDTFIAGLQAAEGLHHRVPCNPLPEISGRWSMTGSVE